MSFLENTPPIANLYINLEGKRMQPICKRYGDKLLSLFCTSVRNGESLLKWNGDGQVVN
ncbi:hypothetical protein [Mucilaginibacter sp. CAU 1740]|uniref:hypothetical protein n=1 Tax=Mucilaginibacter sp. CAU 1740 TaxID=3140365 RepID=UPI00325A5A31